MISKAAERSSEVSAVTLPASIDAGIFLVSGVALAESLID